MQVQYLGTGASEGVPGVFCQCDICASARKNGGKDIRRRSSMLVDKKLLIDMPPDLYAQAIFMKADLSLVEHILITHHHYDHFYPAELRNRLSPYSLKHSAGGITLYGSEEVRTVMENVLGHSTVERLKPHVDFVCVKAFETFEAGSYRITPLKARHSPGSFIYLVEMDGRVMLYATDTGFFPEETWDYLAEKMIHLVSMDCNNPIHSDTPNHMTIEDNVTVRRRLFQQKSSGNRTRYVATHFSHNGGLSHAQIDAKMRIHGITVSYDGMELRV